MQPSSAADATFSFADTLPLGHIRQFRGCIFGYIDVSVQLRMLFTAPSIEGYLWLRAIYGNSFMPRFPRLSLCSSVTEIIASDLMPSSKERGERVMYMLNSMWQTEDGTDSWQASGAIRRYMLDNLTFTQPRDVALEARSMVDMMRAPCSSPSTWIDGAARELKKFKWFRMQMLRKARDMWRTDDSIAQYSCFLYEFLHMSELLISPRDACERHNGEDNAMFRDMRAGPALLNQLVQQQALIALGAMDDVDCKGHNAMQVFASKCHNLDFVVMFKRLSLVIGCSDPATTLTIDGECTVAERIVSVLRQRIAEDHEDKMTEGHVTFLTEQLLSWPCVDHRMRQAYDGSIFFNSHVWTKRGVLHKSMESTMQKRKDDIVRTAAGLYRMK